MTELERIAKEQIINILNEQGYPTYAKLFDLFDLQLTEDPDVVGYMAPQKAKIVLNLNLNTDQISVLVRHEILHEYLTHMERQVAYEKTHPGAAEADKLSAQMGNRLGNLAGDWEISNLGYTAADKRIARSIRLNGKILKGLVTDLDHPEWINLTFEEMFEKLVDEFNKQPDSQQLQQLMQQLSQLNKRTAEDMEDISDEAEDAQQSPDSDQKQKETAKKIGKAAEDAAEDIKDTQEKDAADAKAGKPIDSPAEQKKKEELAKRVAAIKDAFRKAKETGTIESEATGHKRAEVVRAAQRKEDEYKRSGQAQFITSLNNFVKRAVARGRESTWTRFNKTYVDTGLIKPGRRTADVKKIPSIAVYWDVSGSFDDPAKTAGAKAAIASLDQYVKQGKIKIKTYYFADRVSSTIQGAGSGTHGQPVLDNIEETKPDNVIVVSDGDLDYDSYSSSVRVPGAVWFLWYGGVGEAFMDHLHGQQENRSIIMDY